MECIANLLRGIFAFESGIRIFFNFIDWIF